MSALPPGSTIGILGGGQLGRMMAIEAHRLGYKVIGLDPNGAGPLGQVADDMIVADYDDEIAAAHLAERSDVVTLEFENIPDATLASLTSRIAVAPSPHVLATTRHRIREKTFLRDNGFPVTNFARATTAEELAAGLAQIGTPAIVKTCEFGYDGKGQKKVDVPAQAAEVFAELGGGELIIEAIVPFVSECSVICTRGSDGSAATFPVFENEHTNHILDVTHSRPFAERGAPASPCYGAEYCGCIRCDRHAVY